MEKRPTKKECLALYERFKKYCDNAEQSEFTTLLFFDKLIERTIDKYDIMETHSLISMFNVINKIIGE